MIGSIFERAYRRHGPRYLDRALYVQQQLVYAIVIVGVATAALYVDMSLGEFVRLALLGCVLNFAFSVVSLRAIRTLTRPVNAWLAGDRDEEAAVAAWRAAALLPKEVLRRELTSPKLGGVLWAVNLAWSLYLVWELGLSVYAAAPIYLGVMVYISYYLALRFLGMERVVRPVLADISSGLPDGKTPRARGISLQGRLLALLPAINVITAVVADGLARGGEATLADLGLIVLIGAAVAGSVSLVLTLLLSSSILEPIAELREATRRLGAGDFEARVPVATTDETGDLARSFNDMAAGLAERERIRDAFGTYVDRSVAEHILREGTSLAGEEVEVTAMFLDVRDFTGFAERSTAPEVVAALNGLFECVVPIIHEHGGHVDKFIGDGLLAVFGAPRRDEDHADRALAAALAITRCVEERFEGGLSIGLGLNSGVVVAGNVGGAGRFEFSVIGDAVNVAARVESATRKTGDSVLIAGRTRELLRNNGVVLQQRLGVDLKGKRQAVDLFAPRVEEGPRVEQAPQVA